MAYGSPSPQPPRPPQLDSPNTTMADLGMMRSPLHIKEFSKPIAAAAVCQTPAPPTPPPLVSTSQLRCLKTLFRIYSHRVFLNAEECDGVQLPSRTVRSLSRDAWNRFCREILQGGAHGIPLIPYVRMIPLYDEHAASVPYVVPREEFRCPSNKLPPRVPEPVFGWDAFLGLLEDVADRWYAGLSSSKIRGVKRNPWVSAASVRDGPACSPLAAMCDEIACSSFHDPASEQMLTRRQFSLATAGVDESRRSILPKHVALSDLLIVMSA